jgi:hypothetical protein
MSVLVREGVLARVAQSEENEVVAVGRLVRALRMGTDRHAAGAVPVDVVAEDVGDEDVDSAGTRNLSGMME